MLNNYYVAEIDPKWGSWFSLILDFDLRLCLIRYPLLLFSKLLYQSIDQLFVLIGLRVL